MDLKKAISVHKERRKSDNDAIMTVVLKPVQRSTGIKPVMDDLVVAMDRKTNQVCYSQINRLTLSIRSFIRLDEIT